MMPGIREKISTAREKSPSIETLMSRDSAPVQNPRKEPKKPRRKLRGDGST
jgi:hypothetical protein